jgi:Tol biopolymer transport system component/DNA-binding winged helix-turn-helix (wHTH) protein
MSDDLVEFGEITVDLRRVEVRRAGAPVALEPKAFDVLRHLIENRDRLVGKDELLEVVWKDTFVTPNVLTRAVAQLRKALGDDAFEARYIETVARRGYRFIAPVANGKGSGGGDRGTSAGGPPTLEPGARESSRPPAEVPRPPARRWPLLAAALLVAIALAGIATTWFLARQRSAAARGAAPVAPRRLTVESRHAGSPAISPDASTFAYTSFRNGSTEIYVRGMAAGSHELAITNDGGGNVDPEFSPDGQWLAYASRRRGGVWIVPATGGASRQLTAFGAWPSWSPDGQTLVFSSFAGLSSEGVLWTVRRDGGPPVRLTRPGSPPGGHVAPSWSHDGRLIAFRLGRDELRETWVVGADGSNPRRVATRTRPATPRFAPDGRAVYWIGTSAEGNECLTRVAIDRDGQPVGPLEEVIPFPGYVVRSFSISRDLTAVFQLTRLSSNLFAVDLDAAGDAGPARPLTFDDVVNTYPDYGPDGRLAFHQEGAGRPATAWLIDDDGGSREPVSAGLSVSVQVPQWHGDGRRVFGVVTDPAAGPPYFGWIELATRQLKRIPVSTSGVANLPSLSPDGERVAFNVIGADGVVNVWVQPLDGGPRRQVTFDRESMSYPRWSQDGRWLAVNIKRGATAQVGVVRAEGGAVEQLTSGPGPRWPYTFSPDADRIAFGAGESGVWNVFSVSRSTRQVKQLTRFDTGIARFPAWSPRGDRIVFVRQEESSGLWTARLPGAR